MEIYFQSQIGLCEEFKSERKGAKGQASIVISPLKVLGVDTNSMKVISGCSMWQACKNQHCHFSSEARKLPKLKGATG